MKTKGMGHQVEYLRLSDGRVYFGLFMEQGTGKTWSILADVERLYLQGKIDGLFVVAPKGVHINWVAREIPTHMDIHVIAKAWRSGMGVRAKRAMEELFRPREHGEVPPLRVLSMNFEALLTKDGFNFAARFLNATRALFAIDESSRIKNPDAARTKKIMELRPLSAFRRIATGTPITNAPVDCFAQMEFLEEGLLGTTSYRTFVATYAELMDMNHPQMRNLIQKNPRAAHAQIVAKNPDGSPRWRNLEKLQGRLAPHTYRVLKRDCLDLPDKIYKVHPFELTTAQRRAYDLLQAEKRVVIDEELVEVNDLAALVKLQQITSGYFNPPGGGDPIYVTDDNPRLDALVSIMEDIDGKVIIWARFKEELRAIAAAMRKIGRNVVEYHGDVKQVDRDAAVDSMQNGEADTFVGQAQAGGIGLTITAAETTIYYSQDFNLETRLQSEDRNHRIGTKNNVVYIDLQAEDTIDEGISRALQRKSAVASKILDGRRDKRRREHVMKATDSTGSGSGFAEKQSALDFNPTDEFEKVFLRG
jgi:hypothetical protein